jgi:hypothetical protein
MSITRKIWLAVPRRPSAWLTMALLALVLAMVPTAADVQAQKPASITFAKNVAPILQEHCQICHRPNGGAPFSLMSYEETRPWARAIRQRVSTREMPPWHVDKTAGISQYKDDISLSDAQITTILRWVDDGTPLGNPSDLPSPKTFPDPSKWALGAPDLVIRPETDQEMPAAGMDEWVDFVLPLPLKEDRWIKAIEVKPSNPGIVHHLGVHAELLPTSDGSPSTTSLRAGDVIAVPGEGGSPFGEFIFAYAPGKGADVYAPDTGFLLKAGSRIRLTAHYSANGKPGRDRTSIAFKFYPRGERPKNRVISVFASTTPDTLEIPPNSVVTHDLYMPLTKPARVEAWSPHMHRRGKASTLEAILPNGTRQVLSHVDRYAFHWQLTYAFAEDVAPLLPAGTMLHLITVHDNTRANRFNPDPDKWIGYGQGSNDDMAAAFINYVYLDDADFARLSAERKARAAR